MIVCSRLYLFLGISILTGITALYAKEPQVRGDRLVFTLSDLDGRIISSSDTLFEDKVLLVTLWGTWCPPCQSEVPTFINLQERYADDGLIVVGIAFERDTLDHARKERLREFSQKHKINYLILDGGATSDFSTALPMVTDVEGLPIEIMIDRSGTVVISRNGYGYSKKWARDLEKEIEGLLVEKL